MSGVYCDPCQDPYWGSISQLCSWMTTGVVGGGLVGGSIGLIIKGQTRKIRAEANAHVANSMWSYLFSIPKEDYNQTVLDIQMSALKGAGFGLITSIALFIIQSATKEQYCP